MKPSEPMTAKVCRMRAEHNRALAEHMSSATARDNLLRIANEYDVRGRQEARAEESARRVAARTAANSL
jgi:hypothetical protein